MKIFADEITLTKEEFLQLVSGRFKTFKCPYCEGNGWYWVDQDGMKRSHDDENLGEFYYQHVCDFDETECGGLGFRVVFES